MAETDFEAPGGLIRLRRPHTDARSPLRAWSAADELALAELDRRGASLGEVLIVNDAWGALSVALCSAAPTIWTDSALARAAIVANSDANDCPNPTARLLTGVEPPSSAGTGFDTVVIAVPKSAGLLDHQLAAIAPVTKPGALVLGLAMARHLNRNTAAAFERRIGPTQTTRAVKKARLIIATRPTPGPATGRTPGPDAEVTAGRERWVTGAFVTEEGVEVHTAPGVFGGDRLDVGTALLLDTLASRWPRPPVESGSVLDLACGNGVVGASLARRWPGATFTLTDVSDLAVAAARATWQANGIDATRARFVVADGVDALEAIGPNGIDIVVTNPPFHQDHALDPALTDRLLAATARRVTDRGVVAVVAQRHLNLHQRLRRWFDRVETVSAHPSHVVLFCGQPRRS